MLQSENILISVEHDYAVKMLDGLKTAEIRRRQLKIQPGTRVWIYSKLPRGQVEVVATAEGIVTGSPRKLWALYQHRVGITSSEFAAYLRGVEVACVILLRDITQLHPTLNLDTLRRKSRKFHPPQFFKRLVDRGPELRSLISSFATE